jgi:hypothetical protein|tara:strand:+ start:644 stop:838 length:195 start_codon:yes stop_codon:yes gene_type:complete
MKKYTVTFIKDREMDGRKEGDKYGPINKTGYMNLLNGGWIEDEHNLVKPKKQKIKKEKEEEDNN